MERKQQRKCGMTMMTLSANQMWSVNWIIQSRRVADRIGRTERTECPNEPFLCLVMCTTGAARYRGLEGAGGPLLADVRSSGAELRCSLGLGPGFTANHTRYR